MKSLLIASFFVIFLSFGFSSCNKTVTVENTVKTTITEPGSDGFLLTKQVVVKGNTVWGFSQKVGVGVHWRDVVAQNPFLNQPGRIYYNEVRKQWIVLIYPGEVLKIGNEVITPSYVVEETTTKTTTESGFTNMTWLGWIWVGLGAIALIALLVWLFGFYRPMNVSSSSNSSAIIRMDIPNGLGIDAAMTAAIITEERKHRETVLDKMFAHGSVKNFTMDCPDFYLTGEYKGCKPKTKDEPKTDAK